MENTHDDKSQGSYGSLTLDRDSGLHYIIDVATKKRLYKHPACKCGRVGWWFDEVIRESCGVCGG